ncbi:hypothetical protein IFR05_007182 [Cadophora sp. M221]|nr:hypothetical protein IFR05_007182 [Cadophora sp. M221]
MCEEIPATTSRQLYAFDEIDRDMFPALKELHKDLEDDYQNGAWFTDDMYLYVHFSVENEDTTLELA